MKRRTEPPSQLPPAPPPALRARHPRWCAPHPACPGMTTVSANFRDNAFTASNPFWGPTLTLTLTPPQNPPGPPTQPGPATTTPTPMPGDTRCPLNAHMHEKTNRLLQRTCTRTHRYYGNAPPLDPLWTEARTSEPATPTSPSVPNVAVGGIGCDLQPRSGIGNAFKIH